MTIEPIPAPAPSVARLIGELNKLPGIGPKSAQRLAYYIIRLPAEEANALAEAILAVQEKVIFCSVCRNLTDTDPCTICADPRRDGSQLCVVEEPLDVLALERTHCFRGVYYVLHGVISPINGIGPEELKLKQLLARLEGGLVEEVILATNPNLEGEATAMYIRQHVLPSGIRATYLARGLPVGGDLEYADELTLSRAFEGRREL